MRKKKHPLSQSFDYGDPVQHVDFFNRKVDEACARGDSFRREKSALARSMSNRVLEVLKEAQSRRERE